MELNKTELLLANIMLLAEKMSAETPDAKTAVRYKSYGWQLSTCWQVEMPRNQECVGNLGISEGVGK